MIRLNWLKVLRISTVLLLSEAVLVIVIERLACLALLDCLPRLSEVATIEQEHEGAA